MKPTGLERKKWEKEIEWRERDFALRKEELQQANRQVRQSMISMIVSVFAICGSVGASIYVANTAATAARASAETAATSARLSAERSAISAQDSSQRAAAAILNGAERSALAMRETAERNAKASRESLEGKWRLDLQEDQRKTLSALSLGFVSALLPAIELAEGMINHALVSEPTSQEIDAYDERQRENLTNLGIASSRLYLENRNAAFAFAPVHERFKQIDNDVMLIGRADGWSRAARLNGWCRLRIRLGHLNIAPALDRLRSAQLRPGITPPALSVKAPSKLRSDSEMYTPDPEEAKCFKN